MFHMNENDNEFDLMFPGNHMLLIYKKNYEIINIVSNFIKENLTKNRKVIYISSSIDNKKIINKLKTIIDFEKYYTKNQLVFFKNDDSFLSNNSTNIKNKLEYLKGELLSAIKEGYSGLSISFDLNSYNENFEDLHKLESSIDEGFFQDYPVSSLCRYNQEMFSDETMIEIIKVHPYIFWEESINQNPFYIPPRINKEIDVNKHQVNNWLNNISIFVNKNTSIRKEIITSLTELMQIHDLYTNNHNIAVAKISKSIAERLNLSDEEILDAYYSGLAHDIGKIIIPKEILNKKGPLDINEFNIVKQHPRVGYETLRKVSGMDKIAKYILYHHERWDGNGYPVGLKGEEIPIISRIISVADSFDTMLNDRHYRKALSQNEAIEELVENSKTQFDPNIIKIFIDEFDKFMGIENIT